MFDRKPCVYLVGQSYQIVFNTLEHGIAWVEVAGETYPDEQNGLMRSETTVHRAVVPCEALDKAKRYAVCFRPLPERKPYWPELGETERAEYAFRPMGDQPKIYHLADAHSRSEAAIRTGSYFGKDLDLLIMNGDMPAESKTLEDILSIFDVAGAITGGERAVLFARGNHDTRGKYALSFPEYIGTDAGNTYFTFRHGPVWGIVLDCGEDKWDTSEEYGGLVCCQPFRRRQTEFLRRVAENAESEYNAPGVTVRLGVCHVPFMTDLLALHDADKFDIERELYAKWTRLLNQMGLDLMLCGHMHRNHALNVGNEHLRYDCAFPVLVASHPVFAKRGEENGENHLTCAALTIGNNRIEALYTDDEGRAEPAMTVELKN